MNLLLICIQEGDQIAQKKEDITVFIYLHVLVLDDTYTQVLNRKYTGRPAGVLGCPMVLH